MYFKEIENFTAFTELSQRCYPGMALDTKEEKDRYMKHREKMAQEHTIRHIGLYDEENLIGAFIEYDHQMNVHGASVQAAGIGTVAVDLPYKKQGHAKRIVKQFLQDARKNGCVIAHLYPFQPTFYKKMGFGLGSSLATYQFRPVQLPIFEGALPVETLNSADIIEVRNCYQKWAGRTHGATDIEEYGFSFLERENLHTFGVRKEGDLEGYVTCEFKGGKHFLENDLYIKNFFYTSREAYQALIQFLHNQKDQVRTIHFPTFDKDFSYLLNDPVHTDENLIFGIYHKTSVQGKGLMYRVLDMDGFIEKTNPNRFGEETVRVGWKVADTLLEETYDRVWQFTKGEASLTDDPAEVTVTIDIGNFSSLMMGCVTLESLLNSGSASVEGEEEKVLNLFQGLQTPQCWTFF
ncbi:GNAT family N-acetyltransferase [Halobacillus litoralis]|nr:GNAT family N-acetyltransferase [Halobacillus litoralis]